MAIRVTIIGAGPGGYVAAIRSAQLGASVTLIEREAVGGTCLNWGCIPSKVLKTTADLMEQLRESAEMGVQISGPIGLDLEQLNRRKERIVKNQAEGILKLLRQHRVSFIRGNARLSGIGSLSVSGAEGFRSLEYDRLIIAAGSSPFLPAQFPSDPRIWSSNEALMLKEVPESILILGGGVVGCEFASIFAAFGSRVRIVEGMPRLLPVPSVDEGCSRVLQREMKKRKIEFLPNRTVSQVDCRTEKLLVTLSPFAPLASSDTRPKEGEAASESPMEVDRLLICIGRRPNTSEIGLEEAGLRIDSAGWLLSDEQMQTNIAGLYAVGDVLGPSKIMLAHVASAEGIVAAQNAMGFSSRMDYRVVPSTIFTNPEVADVGLTEQQAGRLGYPVRTDTVLYRNIGKAQVLGSIAGEVKIVTSREDGKILGVHIIGAHAADLIAEAALALQQGASVGDLARTIHAHPTLAEGVSEAAHKALDRPIHG